MFARLLTCFATLNQQAQYEHHLVGKCLTLKIMVLKEFGFDLGRKLIAYRAVFDLEDYVHSVTCNDLYTCRIRHKKFLALLLEIKILLLFIDTNQLLQIQVQILLPLDQFLLILSYFAFTKFSVYSLFQYTSRLGIKCHTLLGCKNSQSVKFSAKTQCRFILFRFDSFCFLCFSNINTTWSRVFLKEQVVNCLTVTPS